MRHTLFSNKPLRALAVTGLLCLSLLSQARAQFTVTNTANNTAGHVTFINDPWLNGHPNQLALVTHCYNPYGRGGAYFNSPIGVWYSSSMLQSAVFAQNFTSMPLNTGFNVWVLDGDGTAFVQQANAGNTVGQSTYINNPQTNGHPEARVFMSANYNPGGISSGVYNNHPTGVWYDAFKGKWAIYNQDLAAMPPGAAFNVKVLPPPNMQDYALNYYTHTATASNTVGNVTFLTFGQAYARAYQNNAVIVTPVYNPNSYPLQSNSGVYDTHNIGVYYDATQGKWGIYHEDRTPIQAGAAYNVRITPVPG